MLCFCVREEISYFLVRSHLSNCPIVRPKSNSVVIKEAISTVGLGPGDKSSVVKNFFEPMSERNSTLKAPPLNLILKHHPKLIGAASEALCR